MSGSEANLGQQELFPTQFDVLVIGAGAAGLYAALCLPDNLRVGLITKDALQTGASEWAQGGIAAAIAPTDSAESHLADTLKAGAGLCDEAAVNFLVENASQCIESLVDLGVAFDRKQGKLAMTLEAAHSQPRVLHAADTTGRAIVSTLTNRVLSRPNIKVISQAFALSLWLEPQTKRCQGISLLYQKQIIWLGSPKVILATGGGGQVFAQTTNPTVSTGDGVALAWRAGAIVRDLEFVQFHPTALTKRGAPRFLISEAVRGEGAHLVDEAGNRFTFSYHSAGELAPRDVVSRAIFNHLLENAANPADACVYLDLRPIESERIGYRFPNIIKVCQRWGIDVFSQPIPVAPAAHYWMGGIAADTNNHTSMPGLYTVGETASTGVHGANRLASNSLLECLVFAAQLSKMKGEQDLSLTEDLPPLKLKDNWSIEAEKIATIRQQLPILVWQSAGICRTKEVMEVGIAQINSWRKELTKFSMSYYLLDLPANQTVNLPSQEAEVQLKLYGETFNLLDVAYLILKSAAFRTESRGGHYRGDYPKTLPEWQVHTLVQGDRWWKA
ncbi:MAG: L-aspartate oxidase [Spirulinaceae cyanobacterium]